MAVSSESVMNELQQVQLRAQILVFGRLLQGTVPEEPLMVGAFSDTSTGLEQDSWNEGRHIWEKAWHTASIKAREETAAQDGDAATDPDAEGNAQSTTPRLVESMPTATRSSLTALHPAAFQTEEEDGLQGARKRKKSRLSDSHQDDDAEELDIGQVRQELENAQSMVTSILEHRKTLRPLFQKQDDGQGLLASVTVAFEAAVSAAKAAAAAAALAYEAASQAATGHPAGDRYQQQPDSNPLDYEEISCVVLKAVSQAQIALAIGSSEFRTMNRQNQLATQVDSSMLTEGVNVEVKSGHPEGWLTAKIITVKDGMVLVAYHELVDDSKNHVTEWLHIEPSRSTSFEHPRLRCPYPTFDLNETHDEAPKVWTAGDRIDVRDGHAWREGLVVWAGDDELIVFYSSEGALDSVKSCDVRPSLLWQGNRWILRKDQMEKEAASPGPDLENNADNGETGPSPNHKMRKLIDVILEESEAQRKREENRKAKRQKRNADTKNHSKVTSKVNKAKRLIEKASKPNLQVSASRLTRQFVGKLSPASASGNSSEVVITKRHQILRQLVKLKASPRKSLAKQQQAASKGERPQRVIQPTAKGLASFDMF
ncbi:uncharacterized protein LOC112347021 isoform X2 [Selaginella moellendorffii]|uniref:uncharacterized protein LOC112347021 isoform X2 n=1 Tax=Selaginella moellendorffii TaxID=88036 RepID=UPI000D1C5FA8|nr:uncharacterized protein LOC112347021 isoform X2 [Selaginella moellendorffii]|eukprot:XP_024532881.1 uncharacterized protein LOC112347021 isoform X2 [Selaginella moellendorffii]